MFNTCTCSIANSEPHFKTGDLIVDEFVGMVMVCVVGGEGTTKRTLAIFTVMGVDEQCPIRSCPSATGTHREIV